jgi:UDP-N-acetylglucosamine 1-carboxyvinyltransferase
MPGEDSITIEMHTRPKALDIVTGPFPAFPTDLQPQWSVLAAISDGVSSIQDNIYQQRVDHFEELNKLGAKCRLFSNGAVVSGVEKLHGGVVIARSLRSAASMVIAALKSEKKTKIMNINYIYRGYYGIFDKFKSLINNDI